MEKSTVFAVLVEKSGYVKSPDGDLFTPNIIDAQAFTDFYDAQYVAEKFHGGSVDEAEIACVNTCGEMYAVEIIAERIAGHSRPFCVRQISSAAQLWNETLAAATARRNEECQTNNAPPSA